jgi:hypothetical protein
MTKAELASQVIQKEKTEKNVIYVSFPFQEENLIPDWLFLQEEELFRYGEPENLFFANFEIPPDLLAPQLHQQDEDPAVQQDHRENEAIEQESQTPDRAVSEEPEQDPPSTPDQAFSSDEDQAFFSPENRFSPQPGPSSANMPSPRSRSRDEHQGFYAGLQQRTGDVARMQALAKSLEDVRPPRSQSVPSPTKRTPVPAKKKESFAAAFKREATRLVDKTDALAKSHFKPKPSLPPEPDPPQPVPVPPAPPAPPLLHPRRTRAPSGRESKQTVFFPDEPKCPK